VLEKTMAELSASDAELVVVDLRGLQFMDSTGLHLLIQAQQQAHDLGRRFALVRGPDQVQRLFDLTGLTETLTIVGSPDELLEVEPAPGAREPL
jgi:anti-sigma B factor antagonist